MAKPWRRLRSIGRAAAPPVSIELKDCGKLSARGNIVDHEYDIEHSEPPPRWVVIAIEPITPVDTTAADMLAELDEVLNSAGTSLTSAELKDPARAKLERYQLIGPLDPDHSFRRSTPHSTSSGGRAGLTGHHSPRTGDHVVPSAQLRSSRDRQPSG
jgi:hypothetical protein